MALGTCLTVSCLVHVISLLPDEACLLLVQKCFFQGLWTLQRSHHTEPLSPLSCPVPAPKAKHPSKCENVGKILLCGAPTAHPTFFQEKFETNLTEKVLEVIFDHWNLEDKPGS